MMIEQKIRRQSALLMMLQSRELQNATLIAQCGGGEGGGGAVKLKCVICLKSSR